MIFLGASPAVPDTGPRPEQQKVKVQMFSLTVVPSKASFLNDQPSRGDQVFRAVGTPKAPDGEPDGGHRQPRERSGSPTSCRQPREQSRERRGNDASGPATPRAIPRAARQRRERSGNPASNDAS